MPLDYHELRENLPPEVQDLHRAVASIIEELEAVQWYTERATVAPDAELRSVLEHNRDEEIEHAMMLLEWIRRNYPGFDEKMRTYLFKDAPIVQLEELADAQGDGEAKAGAPAMGEGSLNIGSLKSKGA